MTLKKIYFQHVRRFENQVFDLHPKLTLIHGDNGRGKSTVLEGLYMGSSGQSPRTHKAAELVAFGYELGRVAILDAEENKLGITVTIGQVGGKRTNSKLFTVNDSKKRQKDFVGKYFATIFRPEDMRLIEGSPGRRREYLNLPLCQISYPYHQALTTYNATLLRRNKLLHAIKERQTTSDHLDYWDKILLENGTLLQKMRQDFIDFLNTRDSSLNLEIIYDHSLITRERLDYYRQAELASGHSLIGPHKDDFDILFAVPHHQEKVSIKTFGSRGQQRLAVLWLKLVELAYLEEKHQDKPLLLLDDILSELDEEARSMVIDLTPQYQTVITTTEQSVVQLVNDKFTDLSAIDFNDLK
ncbi:MAG: DNA replication and repair protein RecF [Pseudomonadales bacterium]|nr:DNA replication and repair protein RecF [Pseudomonadales bacterium]